MEHGPVPPHERSWRHPSELAAEESALVRAQAAPATSRAFALTTGTVGLIAIAVLVLAVSPAREQHPVAVSATTAPAGVVPGPVTVASVRRTEPAVTASPSTAVGPTTLVALATPLGSGRYALVSLAAVRSDSTSLDVVLPSGRTTSGTVVERSSESVLVHLSEPEPGRDIAERQPHDLDLVTVMSRPPVQVTFAEVGTLEVEEGTPVVDSSGDLIGLCTGSGGKPTRLIVIDTSMTMLDEALDPDDPDDPEVEATSTTVVATSTTSVPTVDSTDTSTTTVVTSTTSTSTTTVPDDEPPPSSTAD